MTRKHFLVSPDFSSFPWTNPDVATCVSDTHTPCLQVWISNSSPRVTQVYYNVIVNAHLYITAVTSWNIRYLRNNSIVMCNICSECYMERCINDGCSFWTLSLTVFWFLFRCLFTFKLKSLASQVTKRPLSLNRRLCLIKDSEVTIKWDLQSEKSTSFWCP